MEKLSLFLKGTKQQFLKRICMLKKLKNSFANNAIWSWTCSRPQKTMAYHK